MKDLFITATNTDIGKTYTTLLLIEALSEKGLKPGVFKPVETGVTTTPPDASLLLKKVQTVNKKFRNFTVDDVCPIQLALPAAPYVAAKGETLDLEKIQKAYVRLKEACDILLIEGAGGLLVPLDKKFFISDLIGFFDAHTLLVTHDQLGCINDTLLNISYMKDHNIDFNWCVNLRNKEHFNQVTRPFYRDYFPRFYTLQEELDALCTELLNKLA